MAVIKTTNPKVSTLKQGIKYITNPEKTEFITGKDCTAETALEEMQTTKALYNKTKGRQYMHFVQSFKPDDPLDPSKAHQIGLEMAEKRFKGYEVLVATHTDKDHLHNHFIVNSVSFENGAKFQHSKDDLKAVKELRKDCTAETALEEMQTTKALYNKTEGRQYMHFVQSFKPDDPLDPSKAHQIGLEMAEKRFKGYEVLVATHTDKDHLHNHFIVN